VDIPDRTVVFQPGETSRPVTVEFVEDLTPETFLEEFKVALTGNATNAVVDPSEPPLDIGIADDDGAYMPFFPDEVHQLSIRSPLGGAADNVDTHLGQLPLLLPPPDPNFMPSYLNVMIDGEVVISNMSLPAPIPNATDPFAPTPLNVQLALPTPPGVPLFGVDILGTFSEQPIDLLGMEGKPAAQPADVFNLNYQIGGETDGSGETIDLSDILTPDPVPLQLPTLEDILGETVVKQAQMPNIASFVNQVQGENQCCNTAISNSLGYLQANGRAPLLTDYSPGQIGNLLGTTADGTPASWYQAKEAQIEGLAPAFDLAQEIIEVEDDGGLGEAEIDALIAAVNAGKDVEIDLEGHVAVVAGVRVKANGEIELDLFDDNQTDMMADPLRPVTVQDDGGTLKVGGMALERFVVESFPFFDSPVPPGGALREDEFGPDLLDYLM
jgi:hypothetical protein